jgi:hypothetical protein
MKCVFLNSLQKDQHSLNRTCLHCITLINTVHGHNPIQKNMLLEFYDIIHVYKMYVLLKSMFMEILTDFNNIYIHLNKITGYS